MWSLKSYIQMKREFHLMNKLDRLFKKFNKDENLSWYPKFVIGYYELEEQKDELEYETCKLKDEIFDLKEEIFDLKEEIFNSKQEG